MRVVRYIAWLALPLVLAVVARWYVYSGLLNSQSEWPVGTLDSKLVSRVREDLRMANGGFITFGPVEEDGWVTLLAPFNRRQEAVELISKAHSKGSPCFLFKQ